MRLVEREQLQSFTTTKHKSVILAGKEWEHVAETGGLILITLIKVLTAQQSA